MVVGLYLIFVLSKSLFFLYKAKGRLEIAQDQLNDLKDEEASLEAKLGEVESDIFVEAEARNKLNMKKEGEIVLIVPKGEEIENSITSDEEEKGLSNWGKWLMVFGWKK